MDTLASDFAVCTSFAFASRVPLSLDMVVFSGHDETFDEEALLAWGREATGRTVLHMFAG